MQGLVGAVLYGKMEFYRKPHAVNTTESVFSADGVKKLPRVDIIYACADCSSDLIDLSVKNGAKGIVIAGVGDGNMNGNMLKACKRAVDKGVVVVRSTRVPSGFVVRNAEVNDDKFGTIASDELNAPKSRVLLMLCLLQGIEKDKIQDFFYTY